MNSNDHGSRRGPLRGVRIVEFGAIGPAPFCGMLLSDLGADVIRIDRLGSEAIRNATERGRRSLALDLRDPGAIDVCRRLAEQADGLIEGYRPGVMERLGLGPELLLQHAPSLVYGRMTGWGQNGPLAQRAGHDINYIALSGALHAIGPAEQPAIPLNLLGDFASAVYLAFGMVAGILNVRSGGVGQVVDCAMADGVASLMTAIYGMKSVGLWRDERGCNLLDGGWPIYGTYQCSDGKWLAIGPVETKFQKQLFDALGLSLPTSEMTLDDQGWDGLRLELARKIATASRDEWCQLLSEVDACVAPVLSLEEAPQHPHNVARDLFVEIDGVVQPRPVPLFSETPGEIQGPPSEVGADSLSVLNSWGFSEEELQRLQGASFLGQRVSA